MSGFARAVMVVLLLSPVAATGGEATVLDVRIDGKILRKGAGKLVFSLSEFELDGRTQVNLANRRTGETLVVGLSSVYRDSSYSEELSPARFEEIGVDDWAPYVVWSLPDDTAALAARLGAIHEHQNALRLELGKALLEDDAGGSRVSSRISLNKIEKFNRIGATIARRILAKGAGGERDNPFRYPIRIRSSFSPFAAPGGGSSRSPLEQIREVLFWDAHRTLTQQMGIADDLVDLVFDSPNTLRLFAPAGEPGPDGRDGFAPTVVIAAESIDAAMYIARQGTEREIRNRLRTRAFRDDFIRDRPALDVLVNEGRVVAVSGRRLAVTFVPPFMKAEETLYVVVDEGSRDELPVVLGAPSAEAGYTLTEELSDGAVARVRPGMLVRRK